MGDSDAAACQEEWIIVRSCHVILAVLLLAGTAEADDSTRSCAQPAWVLAGAAAARDAGYSREPGVEWMLAALDERPTLGAAVEAIVMVMFNDDWTPGDWFFGPRSTS